MTNLTARELIDTMLRSLAETRAKFKKASPPPADEHTATLQPAEKGSRSVNETIHSETR